MQFKFDKDEKIPHSKIPSPLGGCHITNSYSFLEI